MPINTEDARLIRADLDRMNREEKTRDRRARFDAAIQALTEVFNDLMQDADTPP